ncbi:MAG: hypothetical protein Q9222_004730 [Ikaeria aurantiellina]
MAIIKQGSMQALDNMGRRIIKVITKGRSGEAAMIPIWLSLRTKFGRCSWCSPETATNGFRDDGPGSNGPGGEKRDGWTDVHQCRSQQSTE